jgi:hypothetical protein
MLLYSKLLNPSYPIVLAQYKRNNYGVGNEEEFHWALIVITSKRGLEGPTFQAVDRTYTDGRGKVWESHYAPSLSLMRTRKCLGGIQIGAVKARDLDDLTAVIRGHPATPKFDGWNCRDWIVETIELLSTKGWISAAFGSKHVPGDAQSRYLVHLRVASASTEAATPTPRNFVPVVQWMQ